MRPWLLLVSLLVSDLCPLGDGGDWVVENYSWSLCRKLLLNGETAPRGARILQSQTGRHCMCIQNNCMCVAAQLKQRPSPFYWAYNDHGCSLFQREFTGIIHREQIPALSLLPGKGKTVPAFLLKSDTLRALRVISEITSIKAGRETSHVPMDTIKDVPDSGSAWILHHHAADPGRNFQAFLLKKSKSWVPATAVELQKLLTKPCCAATSVLFSCCLKKGEIRSALKVPRQQMAPPQIRQKWSKQRAVDIKVLEEHRGQALVNQQKIFQAAALHSGSSSLKSSDTSQLKIHMNAVRIMKKNEHLNSDKESLFQRRNAQRQTSLKAASSLYADDDGFYVKRQRLLVSREKKGSINRQRYKLRAARDDNEEDFSGKIITKQVEFRRPEGESDTEQSRTNTIESGNQKRLASDIRRAGFAHKTDNNDVDHKQMLTEVEEEVLITLADRERETQTEPSAQRKVILNTDTGWKTVNIKELDDPPPTERAVKGKLITEPDKSKCKCLKEVPFFKIYALARREGMKMKPAKSAAEVTTYAEKRVKETAGKREETNNTALENRSINQTKRGENVSSEDLVIPSTPLFKMIETETAAAAPVEETTAVNMEIKETTSTEVFSQTGTQKATPASPESETEPRFIRCKTGNTQATTGKPLSGLRMREDALADMTKVYEHRERDGTENEGRASTSGPEDGRKEDQNDPNVESLANPSQTIHKQAADELPKMTDDNAPLCRGLIHRTEAGRKHCLERFAGISSGDLTEDGGEQARTSNPLNDDEYDHFYYVDGVLRRVQYNFYPYNERQRRRKRSRDDSESGDFTETKGGDAGGVLHSYIQRLVLKTKD